MESELKQILSSNFVSSTGQIVSLKKIGKNNAVDMS